MKKTICLLSILSVLLLTGTGCGTIMGKRYSTIRIDATPAADYMVVNSRNEKMAEGRTPGKVKLKAADPETHFAAQYYVVFNAPKQSTQIAVVDSSYTKWWTCGNVLLGGLVAQYIDGQMGASFRLEDVCVQMTPAQFPNQMNPDLTSR